MIIYDGDYSWKGSTALKKRPISWWASTYHLKIIDCSEARSSVVALRPYIAIFTDCGGGASVANCLPELARQICDEFKLQINRVLWVEHNPDDPESSRVAFFEAVTHIGEETLYRVQWRAPRQVEWTQIRALLPKSLPSPA